MRSAQEIEAAMRLETQMAYIDATASEMTKYLATPWTLLRKALDRALGEAWVILPRSAIAADAVAAPAVGVTVAWVNKQIADIDELVRRSGGDEVLTGQWIAYRAVRALLTVAPADDAGEEQ